MAKDKVKPGDLAALIREAGKKAKDTVGESAPTLSDGLVSLGAYTHPKVHDVMTFIEAPWGLGMQLFPVQKFIVKLYYNLPLDSTVKNIVLHDAFRTKEIGRFTETEYLQYLYDQGRCNISKQDKTRRQLVLSIGRRGGKCITGDSLVLTDQGIFPIEQLGSADPEGFSPLSVRVAQAAGREANSSHFYNGGVQPVVSIQSAAGYAVRGTHNHRVLVLGDTGEVGWKFLSDVAIGDYLAINRKTDLWAKSPVDLSLYLPKTQLDESLGARLGHLVGGGRDGTIEEIRVLREIGWQPGCVPWPILRSPRTVVCAFLRGLFEVGGNATSLHCATPRLAHEVQTLLLNLGIVTDAVGQGPDRTLQARGARSYRMLADLTGLKCSEVSSEGATETIPHQQTWVDSLGTFGGVSDTVTHDQVRQALLGAEPTAPQAALAHFERLLDEDFFFDPVVTREEGEEQVYDLTVPDGAAFVANGLVNHNTTLSAIFAAYELYRLLSIGHPQKYYGLPDTNRIQLLAVATGKEQAGLAFNEVSGHLAKCEFFKPYIVNNTQGHVNFQTPFDIEMYGSAKDHNDSGKFESYNGKSSLKLTFKAAVSTGLRGSGNIVIILDEFAHFQDNDGRSSAKGIYDAVVPSALAFSPKDPNDRSKVIGPVESRIICISSPLNKSGKFFELFNFAMSQGKGSENIIAIQAPTWELNPTVDPGYLLERFHEDARIFATEYGAEFSDRVRGWIEREKDLTDCINPELRPKLSGRPRSPHQMGLDVGLVGDGTAVAITHVESDRVVLDYHEVWHAGVSWRESNPHLIAPLTEYAHHLQEAERLDFEEIAKWIVALNQRFYITDGIFDRWNGIPLEQLLHKAGLKQFRSEHFNRELKSKMFQAAKMMMFNKQIEFYDWPRPDHTDGSIVRFSPMIQEILALQAEQTAQNQVVVSAPKMAGCHDDVSDAVIRAITLSLDKMRNVKIGTRRNDSAPVRTPESMARYHRSRALAHGTFTDRVAGPRGSSLRRGR